LILINLYPFAKIYLFCIAEKKKERAWTFRII